MPPTASDARAHDGAATPDAEQVPGLVRRYADLLCQQAEILEGLPGDLEAENIAEAQAYRAVIADLERILSGELAESGLVGS